MILQNMIYQFLIMMLTVINILDLGSILFYSLYGMILQYIIISVMLTLIRP